MFDGLFWAPIKRRAVWTDDGWLNWIILERHRITGAYRTTHIQEKFVHLDELATGGDGS